jgi:single-strand DNA-binding protein
LWKGSKVAKDLNKVMVIGRLGTDPELRHTPSGSPVTTFRVAAGRQWTDAEGTRREETEWFSVVTWNKLAEICRQHLGKGARVYIEGRLQTRSWEDTQSGQTRYKTEVIASDMIILDRGGREASSSFSDSERGSPRGPAADPGDIGDDDIPF